MIAGPAQNELLYILSPSYSGSTLLTFLLATHPRMATVGELKATSMGDVQQYECSCGERIVACDFWRRVREGFARRGASFAVDAFGTDFSLPGDGWAGRWLSADRRGGAFELARRAMLTVHPTCRQAMRRILDRNAMLVDVVCEMTDARVFMDGSKEPIRLQYLLRARRWSIRVIHLVRDGRGQTCSAMRHDGFTMSQAAEEWSRTQLACRRVLQEVPADRQLQLAYEDLCSRPAETLERLFEFAGLDASEGTTDFRSVEHHILGNAMRLGSTSEIRLDEKWRRQLTPQQLAEFDAAAGDWNRRLGYADAEDGVRRE